MYMKRKYTVQIYSIKTWNIAAWLVTSPVGCFMMRRLSPLHLKR